MSLADHASADVRHLWAAVCAQPDEDTPRLMLADALDDCAAFVACVRCPEDEGEEPHPADIPCVWCGGRRVVPSREGLWAEFIRAQVQLHHEEPGYVLDWTQNTKVHDGSANPKIRRAAELCRHLLWPGTGAYPPTKDFPWHSAVWSRGFPAALHAPLQDVFTRHEWPNNAGAWVPTPRALAWVREWGTATRIVLTDRRPYHNAAGAWIWITESNATNEMRTATLPKAVYAALADDIDIMHRGFAKAYLTEAGAVDALAKAVARVLRAALSAP